MRMASGKATHVAYDACAQGYTVRVLAGNDTIDEYNGGNSPFDSTDSLPVGDPAAVDETTLLAWAKKTAEEMAAEYGVTSIENNTDLLDEERELLEV
jgi:hypothetical protein